MIRDLDQLRRGVELVQADLKATLEGLWKLTVSDDYVVMLKRGDVIESCAISRDVDEDALPYGTLQGELSEEWATVALKDEAAGIVADTVMEILRLWNIAWPLCPKHGSQLMACDQTWIDGTNNHDVSAFGSLPAPR